MNENNKEKVNIDIQKIFQRILKERKSFLKVWVITFVLSCIWILPQPRYYTTEVSIVPEASDASANAGGLAALASNFGVNIGNGSSDAIYPQLYPDLFSSTQFIVGLFDIRVKTLDGEVDTDYYTYLKDYQQKNIWFIPFDWIKALIAGFFEKEEPQIEGSDGMRFNPFHLSKETNNILKAVEGNIDCTYSRTTDVVTISVTDQDPYVSATLADSIKEHLQIFITDYRTKKSRIDYEYYKGLTEEARQAFEQARKEFAAFSDAHQSVSLQSVKTKSDNLENEMQMKYNIYTAMSTRMEEAQAKIQENTPAFTTLTNATVPIKPAGPKRMIFVAAMLFLVTVVKIGRMFRKELVEWF